MCYMIQEEAQEEEKEEEEEEEEYEQVCITHNGKTFPEAKLYYVLHLLSGRRRYQDLQWFIEL